MATKGEDQKCGGQELQQVVSLRRSFQGEMAQGCTRENIPKDATAGDWAWQAAGYKREEAIVAAMADTQLAEALEWRKEEAIGEGEVLFVEGLMEVAEVVTKEDMEEKQKKDMGKEEPEEEEKVEQELDHYAEERQKKKEEDYQAQPGPRPTTSRLPLEELQALQLDLEPVNSQATRAYSHLKQKLKQRRKPQLDCRSSIIQSIPGFWAKTFVNHPQMSSMISDQDEDMLSYMTHLEVEEYKHPSHCCKIILFFGNNPYFRNEVITKEYLITINGYQASYSTAVQWYQEYKCEACSHRHHNSSPNFFNWFTDHNFTVSNRITEIISKDLWLNPLHYYKRMKAPEEGAERTGEQAPPEPTAWKHGSPPLLALSNPRVQPLGESRIPALPAFLQYCHEVTVAVKPAVKHCR
ncbi:testis-specific Y-encoded protein 3-like [Marmota flaviventris]|uniref:testis-specific Y-encoded protein 3-like n=1 Tax=Marmota flaviventris TaxID=93162 RepID=UPI003A856CAD